MLRYAPATQPERRYPVSVFIVISLADGARAAGLSAVLAMSDVGYRTRGRQAAAGPCRRLGVNDFHGNA